MTGVNFLNPSDPAFNLANAITSATTNFKVIVSEQYLNPASRISIGGSATTNVKNFGILASSTDATAVLASLPTYNRNNIQTFAWSLPLDAFKTKDWWADGSPRAGVIPTQTGCVNKITNATTGTTGGQIGPNGERHDGALTIQVIDAATTASDLQLEYTGGGAKYGWRVKSTSFSRVLAEYTFFWHHPNGYCYGNGSWLANAPESTGSTFAAVTPPAGTGDPVNGN